MAAASAAALSPGEEKLPVLTATEQVRKLSIEEADSQHPVRLRGVVTYYDGAWQMFFVQDKTGGIFVNCGKVLFSGQAGHLVEIEGVTDAGTFTPLVVATQLKVLEKAALPLPRPVSYGDLAAGQQDCQWVEVVGIVRSVSEETGRLTLKLGLKRASLKAHILDYPKTNRLSLLGGTVRVQGVCTVSANRKRQVTAVALWSPSMNEIAVEKPAPADLFSLPVQLITNLSRLQDRTLAPSLARVQGRIQEQRSPESITIQDDTGSLQIESEPMRTAQPGDRIEAVGFSTVQGKKLVLQDATVRVLNRGTGTNALSTATAPSPPLAPQNLPVLTRVAQVRELIAQEADRHYPVRLRGVVTFSDPEWKLLFVQDSSAGIYVYQTSAEPAVGTGDLIEVEGVSGPGEFSPVVLEPRLRVVGKGTMPAAPLVKLENLATGIQDGQWIEVQGIVRSVSNDVAHAVLQVAAGAGRLKAILSGAASRPLPADLVDARVSLRGVCASVLNQKKQIVGVLLYVSSLDQIRMEAPAPADPFALPVRAAGSLLRFTSQDVFNNRVRVRGVVTLQQKDRSIFIQDESGGLKAELLSNLSFQPGDEVDAAGFPALEGYAPVLQDAIVKRVNTGPPPAPLRITVLQALEGNYDSELVQIRGWLLDHSARAEHHLLVLEAGKIVFEAVVDKSREGESLKSLANGSHLDLTGVCTVQVDAGRMPRSVRILLRSTADITVLARPTWWNRTNALMILSMMAVLVLAGAAWNMTLRKQVQAQTNLIRVRLEREAALEQRHRELVENANDIIYTHDLSGNLTSFNRAAEKITGYSRAEAVQLNIAQLIVPEHLELARQMTALKAQGQGSTTYDLDIKPKAGPRVTLEICSWPLYADGKLAGVQGIARDITERKRIQTREAVFAHLAQKLSGAATPQEASRIILSAAQELQGWDACTLDLYSPEQNRNCPILYIDTINGQRTEISPEEIEIRPTSFSHRVIQEGAKLILRDQPSAGAESLVRFGDAARLSASLLFVPIRNGARVIGVLSIQSYTANAYDQEGLNTLQTLADHCGGALERIRAEQALHESERLFRALIENSSDGIALMSAEGHILYCSPAITALLGFTVEEQAGSSAFAGIHPEDVEPMRRHWQQLMSNPGAKTTGQFRRRHKNGSWRWLEGTAANLLLEPSVKSVVVNYRDITERKQREIQTAAFSSLGQRLSLATTAEEAGNIVVDIADTLLGWDACYLHLLTSEPRRIIPVLNLDIVDGRRMPVPSAYVGMEPSAMDKKVIEEGAQSILRDERAIADANLIRFGDKGRPSASLMFVPIRHGAQVVGVLSIQSYTPKAYGQEDLDLLQSLADLCAGALQRIQAGAALRQSEERFSKAFRASPVAVSISTLAEGRMVDVNEAFLSLFHYQRAEVIGRTALELGLWVDAGDRHKLVLELREHRSVRNQLYQFRAKTGEVRQGLASVEVIDLGQEPCLIFITHDITERLNLEAQFRQAQKMEAVGQLAAGVAHDFNNIMTVIQGHAGLLLASGGMDANMAESLKEISQAADRAARLTRQLLTFSRRQVMQRQVLDLNEVISNMTNMLRRLLGEDIGLHFNFSTSLPPVLADAGMVEQVTMNLALNARDAMPKGGQLIISTLARQIDESCLRRESQARVGYYACLIVKDTGSGMDAATQSKLFEPFFTTKDVGKGTGLGLATVYGIVKQHQGWIEVVSAPGKGSTFKIFLAAHVHGPVPRKTESPVKSKAPTGHETILLVEDEPALRSLARRVLLRYGYRVLEAGSGVEALRIWQQHSDSIQLLLTDMVMPEGMSGRELAEQLQRERKDLKMIFTSGYSLDVVGQDFDLRDGINFLQKPYLPATLAQTVRDCLDG